MRVIAKTILKTFLESHVDCEQQIMAWVKEVANASWESHSALKTHYPSVSILTNNRIVFNIKKNEYRLMVKINYENQIMKILFIGSLSEYDNIDADFV